VQALFLPSGETSLARESFSLFGALLDSKLVSGCMLIKCCHSARKRMICLLPKAKSRVHKYSVVLHGQLFPSYLYSSETVVSRGSMSSRVWSVCPAQEAQEQELQSSKKLKQSAHVCVNRDERRKQTEVSTLHSIASISYCPRDS